MIMLPLDRPHPLEPAPELAELRAHDPVARVRSDGWFVTRYNDARAVLTDQRFSIAIPGVAGGAGPNESLFQDPPGHTRLRRLVGAAFTARRVAALRARTTEIATSLIDAMVPGDDLMAALGFPLPITVIGELLGVPVTEREKFRTWSDALLAVEGDPSAGWLHLSEQVDTLIADKRASPGDDLLSALVDVREADRLSEAELVMMAITLIMAGYITTSVAIGLGAILLTTHGELPRLTGPAPVPTAVEEVLRFQAAGGDVARIATEDVDLAGVRIAAGDKVIISITSANRDERRFADPDRFDITRADNQHLTFGHGIHHCLGAALARMELQVVFTVLAQRLPGLRVTARPDELDWRRSSLFGDEWPKTVPVSW